MEVSRNGKIGFEREHKAHESKTGIIFPFERNDTIAEH